MEGYNPNDISVPNGNYFAFPFSPDRSDLVLMSVPWDVTTSYRPGAAKGPEAIIEASLQLDKYDPDNPDGWKRGIGTLEIDYSIREASKRLRETAEKVIVHLEAGGSVDEEYARRRIQKVNQGSDTLNRAIYERTLEWIGKGKLVGLVGGDHSVPFGYIRALAEHTGDIGILHIDAHADMRRAYEGFRHSHASIMYNVFTEIKQVKSITQVGIRDYCDEEVEFIRSHSGIRSFTDHELSRNRFEGISWREQCNKIIATLPGTVYISFDIDGLSPDLCPGTGTPVPGGLGFNEAVYLLGRVVEKGIKIAGFDLCEVAPGTADQWDANVGARILYKLCNLMLLSNPVK